MLAQILFAAMLSPAWGLNSPHRGETFLGVAQHKSALTHRNSHVAKLQLLILSLGSLFHQADYMEIIEA